MKKKKLIIGGLIAIVCISTFAVMSVSTDNLKGSLYSTKKNANLSTIRIKVNGKLAGITRVKDLSSGFAKAMNSIDKRFDTNFASDRAGFVSGINGVLNNGGINGFAKGTNIVGMIDNKIIPSNDGFFTSREDSVTGIDKNSLVSKGEPQTSDYNDKQAYLDALKDHNDSQTNPPVNDSTEPRPIRFTEELAPRGAPSSNQGVASTTNAVGTTRRFTREMAPRLEDPTSDRAYGSPASVDEFSVKILIKNEALGVGTQDRPTKIDSPEGLDDTNYGTTNPGVSGDSNVNPSDISSVIVSIDCARSMSEDYCGKNTSARFEIILIPNPKTGGSPQR
jgi:hypothetical protein